jgi:CubicO group peptidase (beta-lactamase class C family)
MGDLARAALVCLVAACQGGVTGVEAAQLADSGATYVPGTSWRTAAPAAVGLDATRIGAMRQKVANRQYGTIDGLLIVRYGHLVHEQYIGWSPNAPHTMQSVTKSVTSLLLGILQERVGAGASLDRPVLDLFGRYGEVANLDDRKRALTLRHLVTMRTGMDFWEQPYANSPLDQLNRSAGDWVRFILDRPMTGDPGARWAYNSGAAILSCAMVRELAGEPADAFARRELLAPLGIVGETWYRSPFDGLPHCGGGLNLRPADLARIGYLVLRRGRWGERQVVPAAWIDASTQPVSRGSELIFASLGSGYGYYWWTFPRARGGTDSGVIAASGAGGQWLFVVPDLDLVVAIVASNGNGLDLFYNEVLAAVR